MSSPDYIDHLIVGRIVAELPTQLGHVWECMAPDERTAVTNRWTEMVQRIRLANEVERCASEFANARARLAFAERQRT